jgi:hypothetical protein
MQSWSCWVKALTPRLIPGRFNPFVNATRPGRAPTLDVSAIDPHYLQLNNAVVEKQDIGDLDDGGQARQAYEGTLMIADDFVCGQRKCISALQLEWLLSQLPNPHLRSRKGGHDRHTSAGRMGCTAKVVDRCLVPAKIAVGEVETGDVHPAIQHLKHDFQ